MATAAAAVLACELLVTITVTFACNRRAGGVSSCALDSDSNSRSLPMRSLLPHVLAASAVAAGSRSPVLGAASGSDGAAAAVPKKRKSWVCVYERTRTWHTIQTRIILFSIRESVHSPYTCFSITACTNIYLYTCRTWASSALLYGYIPASLISAFPEPSRAEPSHLISPIAALCSSAHRSRERSSARICDAARPSRSATRPRARPLSAACSRSRLHLQTAPCWVLRAARPHKPLPLAHCTHVASSSPNHQSLPYASRRNSIRLSSSLATSTPFIFLYRHLPTAQFCDLLSPMLRMFESYTAMQIERKYSE